MTEKVTSPAMLVWQLERLTQQLVLVGEHAQDFTCPCTFKYSDPSGKYESENCIPKHLLAIEAYGLETAVMVDNEDLKSILMNIAEEARQIKNVEIEKMCGKEAEQTDISEWARDKRKLLESYLYEFACAIPEGEKTGTLHCCSYRMKPTGEVLLTCRKDGDVLDGLYPSLEDAKKEAAQFCGAAPADEAIVKEVTLMFEKRDNGSGREDEVIKALKEADLEQTTLSAISSAAITGIGIGAGFKFVDWLASKFSKKKLEEGERAKNAEHKEESPYARQLPAYVDVFKTTIAKHYRPTEDFHEGSIRVVKPEPDILVYLGCLKGDDWDAEAERCSPNPTVVKTIVPRSKKYEDELAHLKLVHPEIKVTYRTKEVGTEPVVSEEEQEELEAVDEALKKAEVV